MLIQLSREDVHKCTMLGMDTVKVCEMQGFPPRLENKGQSREEANIFGFKAEFAVARLFDLEPTGLSITSDYGVDLWIQDFPIDVKFTNKIDGPLIFDSMDKFKSQIAILVSRTADDTVMNICGWIGKPMFEKHHRVHNFGWGDRLVIDQDHSAFLPIERLWWHIQTRKFEPKKKEIKNES